MTAPTSPCFNTILLGEAVDTRWHWWLCCFPTVETDLKDITV